MKERIISILSKISSELTYHSTDQISLASGETEILLFEVLAWPLKTRLIKSNY